jgi:aminoglycoside phosphotransferase family enzyme
MKKENYSRNEIIAALRRFDENFVEIEKDIDKMSTKDLYKRLDNTSRVFFADDLIMATKLGF